MKSNEEIIAEYKKKRESLISILTFDAMNQKEAEEELDSFVKLATALASERPTITILEKALNKARAEGREEVVNVVKKHFVVIKKLAGGKEVRISCEGKLLD